MFGKQKSTRATLPVEVSVFPEPLSNTESMFRLVQTWFLSVFDMVHLWEISICLFKHCFIYTAHYEPSYQSSYMCVCVREYDQ